MTKFIYGICIGQLFAMGCMSYYNYVIAPPVKLIFECTTEEKNAAIMRQLVLASDGERFIPDYIVPKPAKKPLQNNSK